MYYLLQEYPEDANSNPKSLEKLIKKVEKDHGDIYSQYLSIMCNQDNTKIVSPEDLD
jgi:hypothetical protein